MYLCPKCGNPYEASSKYCPCCGNATGDISVPNSEDTTFLYCAPSEWAAQDAPAVSPFQTVPDAPAVSPFLTSQPAKMTVIGVPDTTDLRVPASGQQSAAIGAQQSNASRAIDPEPVTPQDSTLTAPIWVTRSMKQPITGPLDESFLDDPSINTPAGEDSYEKRINQSYISTISSSAIADADVDIFDEVFETTTFIYSNIPPKIRKVLLISLITALLSLIPVIYVACSQQKGPGFSKEIQASLTEDRGTSWNIDYGM